MNSREMLISNARKAMLDNITALDKKTLQQELESHLKLEFAYKDEMDRLKIDNKRLQHNEKVFKSRNEKAIEFLEHFDSGQQCEHTKDLAIIVENILQGEDKDVNITN